jgi:hypothetical protein
MKAKFDEISSRNVKNFGISWKDWKFWYFKNIEILGEI